MTLRYKLRTLLILFLFAPPLIYGTVQGMVLVRSRLERAQHRDPWIVRPRYLQEEGIIAGPRHNPSTDQ